MTRLYFEKITRALIDLYILNNNVNNADENKSNSTQKEYKLKIRESENKLNPEGTGCVLQAPSEEMGNPCC